MKREQAIMIISRLLHASNLPFTPEEREAIKRGLESLRQHTLDEALSKKE